MKWQIKSGIERTMLASKYDGQGGYSTRVVSVCSNRRWYGSALSTSTSWCKRAAHRRCSSTAAAAAAAAAARDTAAAATGEARYALIVVARVTFEIFFRTVRRDCSDGAASSHVLAASVSAIRAATARQTQPPHPGGGLSILSGHGEAKYARQRLALTLLTRICNAVPRKVTTLAVPEIMKELAGGF